MRRRRSGQSNGLIPTFGTYLAWEAARSEPVWSRTAADIVDLALTRFIDPASGALREFFDETWSSPPASEAHHRHQTRRRDRGGSECG